ncbi:MAG: NADH-quinone oxidoreductase subunit C [Bacillota bacterium]|jgi:membrane-bound hydrogenase subunit beta
MPITPTDAQSIQEKLVNKFPILDGKIDIPRANRIHVEPVGKTEFEALLDYVYEDLKFDVFHVVVGLHTGDNLEFAYILSNRKDKILLNIKQMVPIANPVIKTVTDKYVSALWHERELVDLLGAVVQGLPHGLTYPLPDGWPKGNYPLRKDWKVEYFDRETMTYNPPAAIEKEGSEKKG